MGKNSFLYSAAVSWNRLPAIMKTIVSLVSFKTALKKWLSSSHGDIYYGVSFIDCYEMYIYMNCECVIGKSYLYEL